MTKNVITMTNFFQNSQLIDMPNQNFCQAFFPDLMFYLTRSAAPSPVFKDGVRKRGSGSTLSKPWPSGRGVEGLTTSDIKFKIHMFGLTYDDGGN
jgi:hypothetical protein